MFCMPWRTIPQVGKHRRGESKSTAQEGCIHFVRYRQRWFLRRNGKIMSPKPAVNLHICARGCSKCPQTNRYGKCTLWTEASIDAVLVTHLAFVEISTGVSAGAATLLIHHVERATLGYSTHKNYKSNLDTTI